MRIVLLADILARAAQLGEEYEKDVLSAGTIAGQVVLIPDGEYARLERKWSGRGQRRIPQVIVMDSVLHGGPHRKLT